MNAEPLTNLLRRDRALVVIGLVLVTVVTWAYTVFGVGMNMTAIEMTGMARDMPMPGTEWTPWTALQMFLMWWVMMIAMMLPSAAPMLLLYARVVRRDKRQNGAVMTWFVAAGYLAMWGAFSLLATVLHGIGEVTGIINGMMASASSYLDAGLLITAGLWQVTPIKHRCLEACRSPIPFLSRIWEPGRAGAFRMGLRHGLFCVGCCWALMLLLFYGGVMNLFWIGGLALLVLAEKIAPKWRVMNALIGGTLIVAGVAVIAAT